MPITAQLVDSTPYRLRYLLSDDGVRGEVPPGWPGFYIAYATLLADSSPGPLRELINANVLGYPAGAVNPVIAAGAMTLAGARAILNSEDAAGTVLTNDLMPRATIHVTARTPANNWNGGPLVDFAWFGDNNINVVFGDGTAVVADAYLDIHVRHTEDL